MHQCEMLQLLSMSASAMFSTQSSKSQCVQTTLPYNAANNANQIVYLMASLFIKHLLHLIKQYKNYKQQLYLI